MLPFCADQGIGVLPYSPLARGVLAGGRRDTPRAVAELADGWQRFDADDADVVDAVDAVAAEHARPPAQVALAWLLGKAPVSAPIIGVTKPHHLDDALSAVDLVLSDEDTARLEAPYRPGAWRPRPPAR